ncbi:hypothetical protein [Streptomyces alkaliphilus]|uniref:hypothetical protein n=1 Tax=Streptomyces alkaliphilus TaxID=1472722 RepID=UPI00129567B0|nr:hypothetical protein [Streptomyces alkaliphilus]
MVEHLLALALALAPARPRDLGHLCFGPVDPGAEELRGRTSPRAGGAGPVSR